MPEQERVAGGNTRQSSWPSSKLAGVGTTLIRLDATLEDTRIRDGKERQR